MTESSDTMTDVWGHIYTDQWQGEPHPHTFERDDGRRDTVADAAHYFVAPRSPAEQGALDGLTGRVLDLGCGVGSYSLYLEGRGLQVVATDASPGAIAVCRQRGCRNARILDIDDITPTLGPFDAVVCMGNTFGIGPDPGALRRRLRHLRTLMVPGGRLVLSLIDPLATADAGHLAYQEANRAAGRPPGLTRARLLYRGEVGGWWVLWMPTASELTEAAASAGWTTIRSMRDGVSVLYELAVAPGQAS
jgi:SAM-dependent methyltransferase